LVNRRKIYEGFPLLRRRPKNLEIESNQASFPVFVVVTHKFTKRQPNGLPDKDYNDGLAEIDYELVTAFDIDCMGVSAIHSGRKLFGGYFDNKP